MTGKTVLTSKEPYPFSEATKTVEAEMATGSVGPFTMRAGENYVIWKFQSEDDAIRHARLFMNMGFEFVQREA